MMKRMGKTPARSSSKYSTLFYVAELNLKPQAYARPIIDYSKQGISQ